MKILRLAYNVGEAAFAHPIIYTQLRFSMIKIKPAIHKDLSSYLSRNIKNIKNRKNHMTLLTIAFPINSIIKNEKGPLVAYSKNTEHIDLVLAVSNRDNIVTLQKKSLSK
jgi:hypothetical protein